MSFRYFLLTVFTFTLFPLAAQPPADPSPEPTALPLISEIAERTPGEDLTTLAALLDSIQLRQKERDQKFQQIDQAVDPAREKSLLNELNQLNSELEELQRRFQTIATQADITLFEGKPEKEFDLQSEIEKLVQPLLAEFERATKETRELAALNEQLELQTERKKVASTAVDNLRPLVGEAEDPELQAELQRQLTVWQGRLRDANNQIKVVESQLRQREEDKESLLETTKGVATGFIQTKGLNLLLGILAFAAVFLSMRGLQALMAKIRPVRKKNKSLSHRLTSLLWSMFTIIGSMGAMLATFNLTGDIFLLSLTLVFLLGIGWAGMKTLPAFVEQFRMMLNMGSVREDERLVYEGLPWKVNVISFRTELINPLLDGGRLELPTRMLVGQLSRPAGKEEEWFPTHAGDWVVLADGLFGKIAYQTPSAVQITALGGSQTVIPTTDFIDRAPTVLSTGFRREIQFGIDYSHQPDVTSTIPAAMQAALEEALTKRLGEDLKHIQVQLAEAADSSLVFTVWVDCAGNAAPSWPAIPLWTQQTLVDLCNRENWGIPFPQLRIHSS